MSKYLTIKGAAILVIVIVLMIPVSMIMNLIYEREQYQNTAVQEIANSSSNAQMITGPILVVPYEEKVKETNPETKKVEEVTKYNAYHIIPQDLKINGKAIVTPKKLGIYQAQTYSADLSFSGDINTEELGDFFKEKGITINEPYFVVSLSDTRGIVGTSSFKLNDKTYTFKEGTGEYSSGKGIHIPVPLEDIIKAHSNEKNSFSFDLNILGTQNLSIVPLGRESNFTLESNWPHPNFLGTISPKTRSITEKGFTAEWQSTWLANNINDQFGKNKHPSFEEEALPAFSVSLIETVNQYQLNTRAVKYAILFIGLTFIGFIMFEAIAQLRLHPVQYILVGFTLVLFYLILLALSEHIGFNRAYLIATIASSALIGIYLIPTLKGIIRSLSFSVGLIILYGLLFIILQTEDFALLLGAALLFIVLAIIMLTTRKIDWYKMAEGKKIQPIQKQKEFPHINSEDFSNDDRQ